MPDDYLTNSAIVAAYREKTPGSEKLAADAREVFPSGVAHDARYIEPYGIYVEHAEGARKWDVDGNEYIDYFGGHGSLILGNCHPQVLAATEKALRDGTHFGTNHPLEIRWAQAVQRLLPSAERVRFTSSGTEATLLAVRLARAFTGRNRIIRFKGHFHGWHDHMTSGFISHFDGTPTPGVVPTLAEHVILHEPNDLEAVTETLSGDGDVAAVILEPTGGSYGMLPTADGFLDGLREVTTRHGVVLIFDEVITGFRVARGSAQGHYGVFPDLTTLGKIISGGLPGAAVTGRKDILDLLDFAESERQGREKILHFGTFNANPVSAATGIAALEIIESTDACDRANEVAAALRSGFNRVLEAEGVAWAAYGTFSAFHIFTNPAGRAIEPGSFDPLECDVEELKGNAPGAADKLCQAMLCNGVDINGWPGGLTSAVHSDGDVSQTIEAFRAAIRMMKQESAI